MLWKEVREQAAILVALLVLGTGVIAAAATLGSTAGQDAEIGDARAYANAGRLAVLSLAVAAGVVVGGTLFAGEKENGTLDCLEALPANRLRLWWGKLAAGLAMATAAGVVLLTAGTLIGALGTQSQAVWLVWGMALVYVAFGWGTFGSTVTESTLAACAVGLVCAVVLGTPVFMVVMGALRALLGDDWAGLRSDAFHRTWAEVPPLLAMYAVAVVPVALAGWVFTAPDRGRRVLRSPLRAVVVPRRVNPSGLLASVKALVWLTNRQWVVAAVVGVGLALLTGFAALAEDVPLLVVWPAASALAGVFGGVLAWADEQSKQTYKFWGERRLPLGRLWLVKVATSFAQTVGWLLLLFGPSLVRGLTTRQPAALPAAFRSGLLAGDGVVALDYLLLWPVYGFAFGHLAGLLFRKTIVALGVGTLTAAPVAALWLPSLLTGGVHGWQLWPVPILVLLSTRLLLRPWSADRLATLRPLATVAGVATAAVAWTAFGLLYRVVEVSPTAEIDDDLKYADTVPQLDFEDGGRAFRQTTSGLAAAFGDARNEFGRRTVVSRLDLYKLADDGWPEDRLRDLGPWLSQRSLEPIVAILKEAAKLPPGPLENPRGIILAQPTYRDANELPAAVAVLLARGLWHQQQLGDPVEFVSCLDAALAASRNARTMQPRAIYFRGVEAEARAFQAVDVWLARLAGRADLIPAAVAVLESHGRRSVRDPNEPFLTERMIDRNRVNGVAQWATRELEAEIDQFWGGRASAAGKQKAAAEAELLNFALAVPWERERFRRVMGLNNARSDSTAYLRGSWLAEYFAPQPAGLTVLDLHTQARVRLTVVQLNLARFERDRGRPAATLDELVPAYLPAVPADPFDGRPLRYRVSAGERIKVGERAEAWMAFAPVPPLPASDAERDALSGAVGGLARLDRPVPIAPGLAPDGTPSADLDAVAAVAGGLVQAVLEPLDEEDPGAGLPFVRMAAGTRPNVDGAVWVEVPPGRGVVWSVGHDRVDDGGRQTVFNQQYRGDILRVVPPPK